jgi:hypothetical protein
VPTSAAAGILLTNLPDDLSDVLLWGPLGGRLVGSSPALSSSCSAGHGEFPRRSSNNRTSAPRQGWSQRFQRGAWEIRQRATFSFYNLCRERSYE